jgi:hypothetical protein
MFMYVDGGAISAVERLKFMGHRGFLFKLYDI